MAQKMFVHKITVTGDFHFPIDMLRYDQCFPDSESDSGRIHRTLQLGGSNEKEVITLVHYGQKSWFPTRARWESFGWKVLKSTLWS
jgi:hypothetical protein